MSNNDWKDTKKARPKYDDSFKEDVLKMILSGRPVSEIAEALGISENLFTPGKRERKRDRSPQIGQLAGIVPMSYKK